MGVVWDVEVAHVGDKAVEFVGDRVVGEADPDERLDGWGEAVV